MKYILTCALLGLVGIGEFLYISRVWGPSFLEQSSPSDLLDFEYTAHNLDAGLCAVCNVGCATFHTLYPEVVDQYETSGMRYSLAITQPRWSGHQAESLRPGKTPQTHSLLSAWKLSSGCLLWAVPIDAQYLKPIGENLLLIALGDMAELNVIDAKTGYTQQRIRLMKMQSKNQRGNDGFGWDAFQNQSWAYDENKMAIYLLAKKISDEQDSDAAGVEYDYYLLKYHLDQSAEEWLQEDSGTQFAGGGEFEWQIKLPYPYRAGVGIKGENIFVFNEFIEPFEPAVMPPTTACLKYLTINSHSGLQVGANEICDVNFGKLDSIDIDDAGKVQLRYGRQI